MKKQIKLFIKISFTILALWIVYRKIDLSKVIEIVKNSNFLYLFLALLFYNFSQIVSAFRNKYVLSLFGLIIDKITAIKLYYIGMFYNTFLPGGIGGDGYKLYYLNKTYHKKVKPILQSLLVDRISGLGGLLFLLGILFLFSKFNKNLTYLDLLALIALYPTLFLVIKFMFKDFLKGFKTYNIYSLIIQSLQVISALFIVLAINEKYIIEFLVLFLISSVVSVIPISFGGVGLRELTFIYGLGYLGLSLDRGVSFSFIFLVITLLSSFIGIFISLEKK